MYAAPVIPHGVKRDHVGVIGEFLAETISQSREAAHVHPHREIGTFRVAGADARRIWIALNRLLMRSDAPRGAVPPFRFRRLAVQL